MDIHVMSSETWKVVREIEEERAGGKYSVNLMELMCNQ